MSEHPILHGQAAIEAAEAAEAACRSDMHHHDDVIEEFAQRAFDFARWRTTIDADEIKLGHPRAKAELDNAAGQTITADGLGEDEVLRIFADVFLVSAALIIPSSAPARWFTLIISASLWYYLAKHVVMAW